MNLRIRCEAEKDWILNGLGSVGSCPEQIEKLDSF